MTGSRPPASLNIGRLGLLTAVALISTAPLASSAQGKLRGSIDWILVLDTSASMRGVGSGTKDIFEKVKRTLADFIRSANEGDSVSIYTFDEDIKLRTNVSIAGEIDKRDLLKAIDDLKANGKRTYTGKAIHDALERANELSKRPSSSERTISIVLFTDGVEDVRGISNPITIPSNISLISKDQPFIFFVSLGEHEHEKQLEDFVKSSALGGRGEVVRDPGATGISEVGNRIRKQLETPAGVKVVVEPEILDFGQIEPGEATRRLTLNARSTQATRARVAIDDSTNNEMILVEPSEEVELKPDETMPIKVRLMAPSDALDGARALRLIVAPGNLQPNGSVIPGIATVRFSLRRVPVWLKALRWLAIALLLAVIAIGVNSFVKGEMPLTTWRNWKERNYLEGELEVLQPRPLQAEDEYISLTRLGTDRARLTELVPRAAGDSDAELATARKNGSKLMQLRRSQGIVRVNNAEVAAIDLYDGDVIEIGSGRLRFNWVGHERSPEPDESI
jgi:hypothetical protein